MFPFSLKLSRCSHLSLWYFQKLSVEPHLCRCPTTVRFECFFPLWIFKRDLFNNDYFRKITSHSLFVSHKFQSSGCFSLGNLQAMSNKTKSFVCLFFIYSRTWPRPSILFSSRVNFLNTFFKKALLLTTIIINSFWCCPAWFFLHWVTRCTLVEWSKNLVCLVDADPFPMKNNRALPIAKKKSKIRKYILMSAAKQWLQETCWK